MMDHVPFERRPMTTLPETPKLFRLRKITHIGTLDAADKGTRGESMEGTGLSVSRHPEAWERIAKLGGSPWWEADASGLRFLDGLKTLSEHKQALEQWGIDQGLATPATAYMVSWMDDEAEEERSFWCESREEAEDEADMLDEASIEECSTVCPTARLLEFMGHDASRAGKPTPAVHDDLATAWAHAMGLDGIWWNERLDPESLSAPRGVIFPEHVSRISWAKVKGPGVRARSLAP